MKIKYEKLAYCERASYICIIQLRKRIINNQTTTTMQATGNNAIDQFIIETSLVSPVNKIIEKLQNGNFRDCDIKWLNTKLENFTKFACQTLQIQISTSSIFEAEKEMVMNEFVTDRFIKRFTTLLEYFVTI